MRIKMSLYTKSISRGKANQCCDCVPLYDMWKVLFWNTLSFNFHKIKNIIHCLLRVGRQDWAVVHWHWNRMLCRSQNSPIQGPRGLRRKKKISITARGLLANTGSKPGTSANPMEKHGVLSTSGLLLWGRKHQPTLPGSSQETRNPHFRWNTLLLSC